jgi:electron transfer flavoprotein beta subunit
MKTLVLVSEGRHPVSGTPCLSRGEAQAVRLATTLDPAPAGLHAGPQADAVREALGRGLAGLTHLPVGSDSDPVPALVAALRTLMPDVVLAGPRAQGGADTGLVPYAIAYALSWPLVADAVAVAADGAPGSVQIVQARSKGARQRIRVRLPVVVTVHAGAPAPLPFAFAKAREGSLVTISVDAPVATSAKDFAERPYRRRPKVMAQLRGSAAERLAAVTGAGAAMGRLLVHPAPRDAAREILAFLREVGVLENRE